MSLYCLSITCINNELSRKITGKVYLSYGLIEECSTLLYADFLGESGKVYTTTLKIKSNGVTLSNIEVSSWTDML